MKQLGLLFLLIGGGWLLNQFGVDLDFLDSPVYLGLFGVIYLLYKIEDKEEKDSLKQP